MKFDIKILGHWNVSVFCGTMLKLELFTPNQNGIRGVKVGLKMAIFARLPRENSSNF